MALISGTSDPGIRLGAPRKLADASTKLPTLMNSSPLPRDLCTAGSSDSLLPENMLYLEGQE
jgi:hypothetical protein